jgi:prepilin-type processing-associated H-X9-DG protein
MRSVGQGLAIYVAQWQAYPAAYIYNGMRITGNVQTPDAAINGYIHWSSYIYEDKSTGGTTGLGAQNDGAYKSTDGWGAFMCPSIPDGGLPPTNPAPNMLVPGQDIDNPPAVDFQAPRCAYTVNEAIMPRNKFVVGFQGAQQAYKYVKAGQVKDASGTILAAEWNPDWNIVADAGRTNPDNKVCKSHRPIHGFIGLTGELNMDQIAADPLGRPVVRRATVADLVGDPRPGTAFSTRLDWVGRVHDKKVLKGGFDQRRTNFLYVDGHVETKSIRETLQPFQWGRKFYSLPNMNIAD